MCLLYINDISERFSGRGNQGIQCRGNGRVRDKGGGRRRLRTRGRIVAQTLVETEDSYCEDFTDNMNAMKIASIHFLKQPTMMNLWMKMGILLTNSHLLIY